MQGPVLEAPAPGAATGDPEGVAPHGTEGVALHGPERVALRDLERVALHSTSFRSIASIDSSSTRCDPHCVRIVRSWPSRIR